MQYLHENKINAYIHDNRFRKRDPKFIGQSINHSQRKASTAKSISSGQRTTGQCIQL